MWFTFRLDRLVAPASMVVHGGSQFSDELLETSGPGAEIRVGVNTECENIGARLAELDSGPSPA
jgi:precorrin-4 methylase